MAIESQAARSQVTQSPSQTIGPFFHYGLLFGGENILTNEETQGQPIAIVGKVLDSDGEGITDAMVEIWQPDGNGIFNHPSDPNQGKVDPHFRGFGRADTVNDGVFTFQTVKPGVVGGATAPYINVRVFARGMLIHAVTRIYFDDESGNGTDPLLSTIAPERRSTLVASLDETQGLPHYHFHIKLQGEGETVFFDA